MLGKKHRQIRDEEDETLQCPSCGKTITLDSMKPVFKKEYRKPGGKIDVPFDMLVRGGWLGKVLDGITCPKCGEIIAVPTGRR